MDNTAALATLKTMLATGAVPARDNGFVTSLVDQETKRGLSDKQWYWVVTLAEKFTAPPPQPKTLAAFDGVYAMFATARINKLKFPKIHLQLPNGEPIKLYLSTQRSRVPDTVNVVSEASGFDDNTWYGRVYADGRWEGGKGTPEATAAVENVLTALAADPEGVARAHGKLTCRCCFCNKKLGDGEDDRSVEVGYGPVCARKFGLSWGSKAV